MVRYVRTLRTIKNAIKKVFRNRKFTLGFYIFLSLVFISIIGRRMLPFNPLRTGRFYPDQPPSLKHPFGTDSLGRDVFGQLLMGVEHSLQIGIVVAVIGTLLGAIIGFIAGYYGSMVDMVLRSVIDVFIVIPMLPLLILISSFFRTVEIWLMAAILSIFSWAWPARQVRGQTLSLKERDFIYMAKLSGMGSIEIIFRELMPHMLQWMMANFTNAVLWAIMAETGLEILGLGPQHTMTLGMLLFWANYHAALFRGLWWWWSPPVFILILIFLSLYLMHVGLDEVINPRLRRRA